jgi:hypothetical protein
VPDLHKSFKNAVTQWVSDMQYYLCNDRLGSGTVVTNQNGGTVQVLCAHTFGDDLLDLNNGYETPYQVFGYEVDMESGMLYEGQRYTLSKRGKPFQTSTDRFWWKYPHLSPYHFCANNPIMYTDVNGDSVVADVKSQSNIKNTLTQQEAKYVRFNSDGVLDTKRLNKSKSTSENMTALKALANSETTYSFAVTDKDHSGDNFREESMQGKGDFYRGVTEMPGASEKPSPDNKVYILVGSVLDEKQQIKTTAHEAFAHAFLFELTGSIDKASHTYKSEFQVFTNSEGQMEIEYGNTPTNIPLENRINTVVKQAETNYESRKKK